MVRYHNFDVVFAEIPGETTLALNITGCPNRCPGCHSPHLQADEGRVLDEAELLGLLARYGRSVTCVAFMGGDAGPHKIARLAGTVRKTCPELRTAWYSGREELPEGFAAENHLVGDHHVGFAAAVGDLFADRGPITRVVAQRADGPEVGVAERVFVQKYDVRLHILCVFVNCVRRRGLGSRMRIRSAAL